MTTSGIGSEVSGPAESGGGSNCCENHGGLGCTDPVVEECVCAIDELCCGTSWDAICVSTAHNECGAECGLDASCCMPSKEPYCNDASIDQNCVCELEPSCCDAAWTAGCVALANGACKQDCVVDGDCCTPHGGPGCNEPDVLVCVCGVNGLTNCCTDSWTEDCANFAYTECFLECPLPPGPPKPKGPP